jgi:hypothetical protein
VESPPGRRLRLSFPFINRLPVEDFVVLEQLPVKATCVEPTVTASGQGTDCGSRFSWIERAFLKPRSHRRAEPIRVGGAKAPREAAQRRFYGCSRTLLTSDAGHDNSVIREHRVSLSQSLQIVSGLPTSFQGSTPSDYPFEIGRRYRR